MKDHFKTIPYQASNLDEGAMLQKSEEFNLLMNRRRSVRDFSDKPLPKGIVENILMTANSAPSGANKQPWTFCVVTNNEIKKRIRREAEIEEYKAYHGGMPEQWLEDLSYLGTDWNKEFLEVAPLIIVVFRKSYDIINGQKRKNYYVQESVGLACGFLLAAIHNCGLVALTHTPSPMDFLRQILERPENEKPFLLIPIGYPANDALVPNIQRKKLSEFVEFYT